MGFRRHWVVGVPVDDVSEGDVLDFVADRVERGETGRIVTVNAEYVVKAVDDAAFRDAIEAADVATADGAGVLWALKRQSVHIPRRVGGSDLIWTISGLAADHGFRVYYLGAAEGVAARAAARLQARYPGLAIAGAFAGSPEMQDRDAIVDSIRRSRADILFVAFGAPRQDIWIAENLVATGAKVGMGVGGSFDYVAGVARRAPHWMQDHGLDWLWRLVRQPRRWRRMLALPRFVWLVLREARRRPQRG